MLFEISSKIFIVFQVLETISQLTGKNRYINRTSVTF